MIVSGHAWLNNEIDLCYVGIFGYYYCGLLTSEMVSVFKIRFLSNDFYLQKHHVGVALALNLYSCCVSQFRRCRWVKLLLARKSLDCLRAL